MASAALSAFAPRQAEAQESKPESRAEEAIQKGREGVALYEGGKWSEALAAFREADARFHSPVLTLYTARSLRNLGRLVESKRVYETLSREALDASAPRPWTQAQLDGNAELKALDAETPRLVVDVGATPGTAPGSPGGARAASASVDGAAVIPGEAVALDPGEHIVEVVWVSGRRSQKVTLRRGEGTTRVAMGTAPRPPEDPGTDGYTVLGIVLTGVGGAALAAGGIFGIVALNEASTAEEGLPASCTAALECLPKERAAVEPTYDEANTTASVADALFIGGGIAAAAGIAILILDPGAAPRVQPTAMRSGGGLRLSF